MCSFPVRPDADLDDQRRLQCRDISHQPRQVGADFDELVVGSFQHQFVMHLQDEA